MAKHSAPRTEGRGNPDQRPGKHTTDAKPQSEPVMGKITRDLIEGVRGHADGDAPTR